MASYAGAYGAGGAADALKDLLAQRFMERRQAEVERATKADETFRQQEMAAAQDRALRNEAIARDDSQERKRQFDLTNQERQDARREDRITHDMDAQKRAMERADDAAAGLEGEDRQRQFQREERLGRQQFEERLMRSRQASSGDSEPLVSITDPQTGQPKLVRRSEAIGQRPGSTREQALTEGQSNAAGFADRMKFNEQFIQPFESGATSRWTQFSNMVLPKEGQSDPQKQYNDAKSNWIAANLRKESGAAIGPNEYRDADLQYFPQPGDSEAQIKQKRQLRGVAEAAMRRASGAAGVTEGGGAAAVTGADNTGGAPPRITRKIRNPTTGETRMQTSTDGGATWN